MFKITREALAQLEWREFGPMEYMTFAGVESPVPLVANFIDVDGVEWIVILDGDKCEAFSDDREIMLFCENVRELPRKTEKQRQIENRLADLKHEVAELEKLLAE